jgi:microcystin-dependent protein
VTVPSTVSSVVYTGTGLTASFAYTWQIVRDADLIVWNINAAGTLATRLTLTTDYTVTGADIPTGGEVTLVAGNLVTGERLFIGSDPEQIQSLLLQQGAAFNPADLMAALDLATREVQANRRLISGAIQFPVAESLDGLSALLPTAINRANGVVAFDADGNVIVGGGLSSVIVSVAMVPVVQAASTSAAFLLLGGLPLTGGTMAGAIAMAGFAITGLPSPGSSSAAATKGYVDAALAASAVPVGCSIEWNGAGAVPTGFFEEDGSAVSRVTYVALFTAIGTTWGIGDGVNTFNLPDSRGKVSVGAGTGSGLTPRVLAATGGEEDHFLTTPEIPAHNHTLTMRNQTGTSSVPEASGSGGATFTATTANTGGGGGHNTMQPFLVKRKIIRWQV